MCCVKMADNWSGKGERKKASSVILSHVVVEQGRRVICRCGQHLLLL